MSADAWIWSLYAVYCAWWAVASMLKRRRQWRQLEPYRLTCGRVEVRVYERADYWRIWRNMRAKVDIIVDGRWASTHCGGVKTIRLTALTALTIGARAGGAA